MLSRLASVQSFWIKNANFEIRGVRLSIEETLFIATRNILKRNIRVGGKFFWKKMFLYTWFHGFAALNSHSNTVISKCVERNYRNSSFRTRLMKQNFSKPPSNFMGKKCYSNDHIFIYIFYGYSVTIKKVKKKSYMHFSLCDTCREAPVMRGYYGYFVWHYIWQRWRDNLARETSVTNKSPRSRLKSTKRILGELKFILHVH